MSSLKKYGFQFLFSIATILLGLMLSATLYYFNLINTTTHSIIKIIILLIALFSNSFVLGKSASCKGYLEGIKLAVSIIIFFTILNLITARVFSIRTILYYLIISLASAFGGMVGISRKKESK